MADNTSIKNSAGVTVSAATDELSDSSQSPKVTLLDGTGSPTPISPPIKGQFPTTIGPKAASGSMSVTLSTDDDLLIGALTETAPASDTASSGLNGRLQRIAQRLTSLIALIPAALGQGTMAQSMRVVIASDQSAVQASGWGFDVPVTPTVTAGAYAAGDIMGGLITFANVAHAADKLVVVSGVQVISKAAVTPALTLHIFNADPTSTTKTDNAAYSLNAADAFKVVKSIVLPTTWNDHGTPNSVSSENIGLVAAPVSGGRDLYGLLVDATGVTLTSTSDIQVRLRGVGA